MVAEGTDDLGGGGNGEGEVKREEVGIQRLPASKQAALQMILGGQTVAEAARVTGVTRMTIHRWLKSDPEFQAAYNEWQEQIIGSTQARLLAMTDKAAEAVEKALEAGDARLGLKLLKEMGLLKTKKPGFTDPKRVRREMQNEEDRVERNLNFGLGG